MKSLAGFLAGPAGFFQYRLAGYDQNWRFTRDRRAEYLNLGGMANSRSQSLPRLDLRQNCGESHFEIIGCLRPQPVAIGEAKKTT